jgi:hypothetical protein
VQLLLPATACHPTAPFVSPRQSCRATRRASHNTTTTFQQQQEIICDTVKLRITPNQLSINQSINQLLPIVELLEAAALVDTARAIDTAVSRSTSFATTTYQPAAHRRGHPSASRARRETQAALLEARLCWAKHIRPNSNRSSFWGSNYRTKAVVSRGPLSSWSVLIDSGD